METGICSDTLEDGSSSDTMLWPGKSSESLEEFVGLFDAVLRPAEMSARSRKACLQHMMDELPEPVRNCIMALKHNQMQQLKISEQFYREVYELEKRYCLQCVELFDSRRLIVEGSVEPPPMEPSWSEEADELVQELKASKEFQQLVVFMPQMPYNAVVVPRFWLSICRNVSLLSDLVESHDEPLLECLVDLRISYEPAAYTIQFLFHQKYFLQHQADPELRGLPHPLALTLQANALPRESFFNFFSPLQPLELSLADEKTKMLLANDFEVGFLLRTQIVPKAVLYYTGDLVDSTNEALNDSDSSETSEAEAETETDAETESEAV
ncbi:LOW QUALITY PROTEIN: nucleosome assembly protein 1-like 3 [Drosophila subobscura]|uniref:LOW QUALITY PROTEIN: nucleosome assembly protein 1-like 3 n=1 Tax=Drosophila subobscura TaxID=7241 RepID=UPI00155A671B|nr:LOW QUALITY PROTEIN: nucleosome assembly protein 1-like 3 [Drosophila subobscura]